MKAIGGFPETNLKQPDPQSFANHLYIGDEFKVTDELWFG